MTHWQQRAEREDPYPDVPFGEPGWLSPDALVGLVCIAAAFVAVLCGR